MMVFPRGLPSYCNRILRSLRRSFPFCRCDGFFDCEEGRGVGEEVIIWEVIKVVRHYATEEMTGERVENGDGRASHIRIGF